MIDETVDQLIADEFKSNSSKTVPNTNNAHNKSFL